MISDTELQKRIDIVQSSSDRNEWPSGMFHFSWAKLGKSKWEGRNTMRSHPSQVKRFQDGVEVSRCHAELNALNKVPRQCRHKIKLYIIRITRDGSLSMSRPCSNCCKVLEEQGIDPKNIWYTHWDKTWRRMSDDVDSID